MDGCGEAHVRWQMNSGRCVAQAQQGSRDSPFSDSSTGTFPAADKSASNPRLFDFASMAACPRSWATVLQPCWPARLRASWWTHTVNLPLPPLFRLISSSCPRPAPLVSAYISSTSFGRRATYWKGLYLECSSNSSSADHPLQSRDWLRELSTTAAPREAWRCCEDRLALRVGETVRKLAGATGLHTILISHTARHGHEPQ